MREREVVRDDRPVEREVVVDDRPPSRGGGGGIVAAIIGVLLVVFLAWFLFSVLGVMDRGVEEGIDAEVNIEQQEQPAGDDGANEQPAGDGDTDG